MNNPLAFPCVRLADSVQIPLFCASRADKIILTRLVEDEMIWLEAPYDDEACAAELTARDRAVETEFEPVYDLARGAELNRLAGEHDPAFKKAMEERRGSGGGENEAG
jgi:hypothetical protein